MNKSFTLIALGALLVGTVACSSAPKVEESAPLPEASAAPAPIEPSAPAEDLSAAPAKSSTSSGMSLGAGSSGRGH